MYLQNKDKNEININKGGLLLYFFYKINYNYHLDGKRKEMFYL